MGINNWISKEKGGFWRQPAKVHCNKYKQKKDPTGGLEFLQTFIHLFESGPHIPPPLGCWTQLTHTHYSFSLSSPPTPTISLSPSLPPKTAVNHKAREGKRERRERRGEESPTHQLLQLALHQNKTKQNKLFPYLSLSLSRLELCVICQGYFLEKPSPEKFKNLAALPKKWNLWRHTPKIKEAIIPTQTTTNRPPPYNSTITTTKVNPNPVLGPVQPHPMVHSWAPSPSNNQET